MAMLSLCYRPVSDSKEGGENVTQMAPSALQEGGKPKSPVVYNPDTGLPVPEEESVTETEEKARLAHKEFAKNEVEKWSDYVNTYREEPLNPAAMVVSPPMARYLDQLDPEERSTEGVFSEVEREKARLTGLVDIQQETLMRIKHQVYPNKDVYDLGYWEGEQVGRWREEAGVNNGEGEQVGQWREREEAGVNNGAGRVQQQTFPALDPILDYDEYVDRSFRRAHLAQDYLTHLALKKGVDFESLYNLWLLWRFPILILSPAFYQISDENVLGGVRRGQCPRLWRAMWGGYSCTR